MSLLPVIHCSEAVQRLIILLHCSYLIAYGPYPIAYALSILLFAANGRRVAANKGVMLLYVCYWRIVQPVINKALSFFFKAKQ